MGWLSGLYWAVFRTGDKFALESVQKFSVHFLRQDPLIFNYNLNNIDNLRESRKQSLMSMLG
jgi:hypothetical protein